MSNKHIAIVDLNENANDFAGRIGIIAIEPNRYVCASLNEDGERRHGQTFTLEKSIDGLPPNNKALEADVLKAWSKHSEKIERQNPHD
jgi:hypothetical protein